MSKLQTLFTSRRFWAAVGAVVVPMLNQKFNWGLTDEVFITTAIAIVGWIVGESLRSSEAEPK